MIVNVVVKTISLSGTGRKMGLIIGNQYPVTIDGIQKTLISYTATLNYNRDAVMSLPIV